MTQDIQGAGIGSTTNAGPGLLVTQNANIIAFSAAQATVVANGSVDVLTSLTTTRYLTFLDVWRVGPSGAADTTLDESIVIVGEQSAVAVTYTRMLYVAGQTTLVGASFGQHFQDRPGTGFFVKDILPNDTSFKIRFTQTSGNIAGTVNIVAHLATRQ